MTTAERIAYLENQLRTVRETISSLQRELSETRETLFRERHGYGVGDWVLCKDEPAFVFRTNVTTDPEYDGISLRAITKAGAISKKPMYLPTWDYLKLITPWPADRPLPEVKDDLD